MTDELLPCPMCGSSAKIDATGTAECYGHAWQSLSIECSDERDKFCGMQLSLDMDFHHSRNAQEVLINAWNSLERRKCLLLPITRITGS